MCIGNIAVIFVRKGHCDSRLTGPFCDLDHVSTMTSTYSLREGGLRPLYPSGMEHGRKVRWMMWWYRVHDWR